MQIIKLITEIDRKIALEKNVERKNKLQLNMLLIECK
jgi:hypothetical protein